MTKIPKSRFTHLIGTFIKSGRAVAAIEFAFMMPVLILFMLAGVETVRYVNTSRQLTEFVYSAASLIAERTSNITLNDIIFGKTSVVVTFPGILSDAARKNTVWSTDMQYTASSIVFTPTINGCTSNCTYNAKVAWTFGANPRPCNVSLTSVSDSASPSPSSLPADVFTSGSIIVVDLIYTYTPIFGAQFVPIIQMKRSAYLQPRYLTSISYTNSTGNPAFDSPCS
jgi:Flp pilus assembly protein TadG